MQGAFRWRKMGLVHAARGREPWEQSYALIPTPVELEPGLVRVFYSSVDRDMFGSSAWIDVRLPAGVVERSSDGPVLTPGEIGCFDDSGVNISSVVRNGQRWLAYYVGWQRSERVPYLLLAGVASAAQLSGPFERLRRVPVLERTDREPYIRSAPSVMVDDGAWRAWYVSASEWETIGGKLMPVYEIRHARSLDGIEWTSDTVPVIRHESPDEFGFGRPWVVRDGDLYRMWYSIRSRVRPYRIGYAESRDGIEWQRSDSEAGIGVSDSGWDSEMICYAATIRSAGCWWMFYNGNRHGSTGFGLAVAESCP